jgi:hypothetical protein
MSITTINGVVVLEIPAQGPPLGSERDATDLIGEGYGHGVEVIALPVSRLHPDFLNLSTRMAGLFLQKLVTYSTRAAIVGDISAAVAASPALRDFVYESNKGGHVMFVADAAELAGRLQLGNKPAR